MLEILIGAAIAFLLLWLFKVSKKKRTASYEVAPQPGRAPEASQFASKREIDRLMAPHLEMRDDLKKCFVKEHTANDPADRLAQLDKAVSDSQMVAEAVGRIIDTADLSSDAASSGLLSEYEDFDQLSADLEDARNEFLEDVLMEWEQRENIAPSLEPRTFDEVERLAREHIKGLQSGS